MATQRATASPAGALTSREDSGSAENARRSKRQTLVTAAALWRSYKASDQPGERVFVSNISLGGLAFRARMALETGTVNYLKLVSGPLQLEAQIRIAWCRPHDADTFDAGAEFIRE